MKNFDSFEIDCRPVTRRSCGGITGFSKNLVCYGTFGFGTSESHQTSNTLNLQTTLQGGGAGSAAIGIGAQASVRDITVSSVAPEVVDSAFKFGAESQTIAAQTIGQANQTVNYLAGQLATITANAAPQTAAAQSEIAAGSSPFGGGGIYSVSNNAIKYGTVVAVVAVAAYLYFTRK